MHAMLRRALMLVVAVSMSFLWSSRAHATSLGDAILADGPISYWSFDEAQSGTTTALDPVGGNNGTFGGTAKRTLGLAGAGAAIYTGTSGQTVNVTNGGGDFAVTTGVTIEALIRPSAALGSLAFEELFRKEDGGNRLLFSFQNNATILSFGLNAGGYTELDMPLDGVAGRPTLAQLKDGNIHHVAATYDSVTGDRTLYVDGTPRFSDNRGAGTLIGTTNPGVAGHIGSSAGGEPFQGVIDDVAIYGSALSSSQILNHASLVASSAPAVSMVVLSTDVLGPGRYNDGYSNGAVEIVRNVATGTGLGVPYTSNGGGPTLDIPNFVPLGFAAGNLGSDIHGRGAPLFLPGDGETVANNNGGIGIGAHATWLVTFDLDELRDDFLNGTDVGLRLTGRYGQNGQGNPGEIVNSGGLSQGLIYLDGALIFNSDLKSTVTFSDAIDMALSSGQYLTFVIANGNNSTFFDDGSFRDLKLTLIPEPASLALLGLGGLALLRRRRA